MSSFALTFRYSCIRLNDAKEAATVGKTVMTMLSGLFNSEKIDRDVKALDIVRVPFVCGTMAAKAINVRTGLKIEVICARAVSDHTALIQSGAGFTQSYRPGQECSKPF